MSEEIKRYYLWVEKYGGSQEMLEHKGQDLPSQDLDAAGEYVGFNHDPLYVLADDHESKLAALREELKLDAALKVLAEGVIAELRDDIRELKQRLAEALNMIEELKG